MMKGFDNPTYLTGYIVSNIVALFMLWAALRRPRLARLLFFLLFGWACGLNLSLSQMHPREYITYADLAFSGFYHDFIVGWFSHNISFFVGTIAIGQGLIAIALLLKGVILRLGLIGAIIFLLAIMPLGVGSAFPCTLIMAIAATLLLKNNKHKYLWKK